MADEIMTPEQKQEALRMLGAGAARNAGNTLAGRQAQLQAAEQAAMGGAPAPVPQTVLGGPQEVPPAPVVAPTPAQPAKSPSMMRKLADLLRGAGKR